MPNAAVPARTGKVAGLTLGSRLRLPELLRALHEDGLVDAAGLRHVLAIERATEKSSPLHPLVIIANQKLIDPREGRPLGLEQLTQWLATRLELPYQKLDPMKIDVAAVTQVVSQAYAQRYRILPVNADVRTVTFATAEPLDIAWRDDLEPLLRRQIQLVVANPLDVNRFLMEFYGVSRSVQRATDAKTGTSLPAQLLNFEQLLELGQAGDVNADDRHVVHIVDWLLQFAFDQRASDIHLEPRRDSSPVRFRIDGVMHTVFQLPTPVMTAVTSRIKILGRMDVAEKRRPQDGRIKTRSPGGREVELRLSTMPTAFGEKCVLRIFDPDIVVKPFDALGFSAQDIATWQHMVERPHGIVLVTGPTGSGKTTTLYSTLKVLARPELNVCTVEDPIEMVSPEFNQMQVQPAIDLDFAQGVRTLLRQDPDIIMVGEIRDLETAHMAVQASLTGHLVLSTLHTNDAVSAITRLQDLGVPHYLIASTLAGIVAQRLVRTLCAHCKQPGDVEPEAWAAFLHPLVQPLPQQAHTPVGCVECRNTGYLGRSGIYEMLPITPALRRLIRPDTELAALRDQAAAEGMRPLRLAAAEKVATGLTTLPEVLKVLPPAQDL